MIHDTRQLLAPVPVCRKLFLFCQCTQYELGKMVSTINFTYDFNIPYCDAKQRTNWELEESMHSCYNYFIDNTFHNQQIMTSHAAHALYHKKFALLQSVSNKRKLLDDGLIPDGVVSTFDESEAIVGIPAEITTNIVHNGETDIIEVHDGVADSSSGYVV